MAYGIFPAEIDTANTNRDGTGALVDVVTGGANGTRVDNVVVKAEGVTTAGMVRFFVKQGGTSYLYHEMDVTAVAAPGVTTPTFEDSFAPEKLTLASGEKLQASTHNAEIFKVIAQGVAF